MFSGGAIGSNYNALPLASFEYFELIELLVFQIVLPSRGLSAAHRQLKEVPLPKRISVQFENRLVDIRNVTVADVALSKGTIGEEKKLEFH